MTLSLLVYQLTTKLRLYPINPCTHLPIFNGSFVLVYFIVKCIELSQQRDACTLCTYYDTYFLWTVSLFSFVMAVEGFLQHRPSIHILGKTNGVMGEGPWIRQHHIYRLTDFRDLDGMKEKGISFFILAFWVFACRKRWTS